MAVTPHGISSARRSLLDGQRRYSFLQNKSTFSTLHRQYRRVCHVRHCAAKTWTLTRRNRRGWPLGFCFAPAEDPSPALRAPVPHCREVRRKNSTPQNQDERSEMLSPRFHPARAGLSGRRGRRGPDRCPRRSKPISSQAERVQRPPAKKRPFGRISPCSFTGVVAVTQSQKASYG